MVDPQGCLYVKAPDGSLIPLRGPRGEKGDTGLAGAQGVQGVQGTAGPQGPPGDQATGGGLPPSTPANDGDLLTVDQAGLPLWSPVFGDNLAAALNRIISLEEFTNNLTEDTAEPWVAGAYPANSVVLHNGGIWINTVGPVVAGDVPGVSPKWESLSLEDILAKTKLDGRAPGVTKPLNKIVPIGADPIMGATTPVLLGVLADAIVPMNSEAQGARNMFLGHMDNQLLLWNHKPYVRKCTVTGTAVPVPDTAMQSLIDPITSGSGVVLDPGATPAGSSITIEFTKGTAPNLPSYSHGYATPFVRLRMAYPDLHAKIECLDGDTGAATWVTVYDGVPNAVNSTVYLCNELPWAAPLYQPQGIRVTFDLSNRPAGAASRVYLPEIGIYHESAPFGINRFPFLSKANEFYGPQAFMDGVTIPTGRGAGKVLTSDDAGRGAWADLPVPAAPAEVAVGPTEPTEPSVLLWVKTGATP